MLSYKNIDAKDSGMGDVYIADVDNYTERHIGPGEEIYGEFRQEEAVPELKYTFSMHCSLHALPSL